MSLALVVIGVACLIYGVVKVTGIKPEDTSKDSDLDKKLMSEKTRYFIGRYWAGAKLITAGLGAIALGVALYFLQ
jgi:hypothetical protein